MRKLLFLILSVAVATGAAIAAPPNHRPTGKLAAELSKPSDFKKPFRPLVPTRSKSYNANQIPGLYGAVTNPIMATKQSKPRAKAASTKSVELSSGLKLRGSVLASENFTFIPGMYNIPTTNEGSFELVTSNFIAEYGAYDDGNGRYYVASVLDYGMGFVIPELYVYSTETWEQVDYIECDYTILGVDNATDPTTGKVYGCYYDENYENLAWAEADYASGVSRTIKVLGEGEKMFGVACDGNGQYYAVLENGNFVKVDKATGDYVVVGDTGLHPYYSTGATFDEKSNTFIFCYSPAAGTGSMWGIDPATGTATLILDFPENEEVAALMTISPEAEPLAPAAPVISVTAAMGSMTVSYQITMPSTLFNGDRPDGSLKWSLLVDGTVVRSEESYFGVDVYGSYTLETKGSHTFTVYAENEVGRSPLAKQTVIVGSGVPKAPANATANTDGNGSIWLSWDAVTEAADGGYVNPDEITYTISRDGKVLSEGKSETYYEETVEIPETYSKLSYEIRAVYAEYKSEVAMAEIGVGSITPPYVCGFSAEPYDSDLYTAINANDDNVAWYFSPYYGSFKYDYNSDLAADDWLISPAFHLEAGKIYEFSFSVAAGSTMYSERYEVAMGMAATANAMTTELVPETDLTGDLTTPTIKTITINPTTTGNYYFGWHALSEAAMFMIQVKDIKVSAAMVATSPAEVSNFVLTPAADGYLKLSGSFNAPAVDISGKPLASIGKIIVTRDGKETPIAQFESVSADEALTFSDNDIPEMGTYTYSVTAWDADGNIGRTTSASVYVGPVAPENVPAVYAKETETLGEVIVTWDAPEMNVEGAPLKDENLTYMVYVADANGMATELLEEPTTTREARFTVCQPDEQKFALFYVKAFNLGLESPDFTRSPMVPVGKSETLPYVHSFNTDDRSAHLLGYVVPTDAYGEVTIDNAASASVAAQDGDDAFIKVYCSMPNKTIEFFTGKIDLAGATNPAVSIYHYVWSDADKNTFDVYATTTDGMTYGIGKIDHADGYSEGWNLARFSLGAVSGKVVKITVSATVVSHENMLFDNLRIADLHDTDLAATSVAVPSRIEPGKEFPVKVTIANLGLNDCEEYKVDLMLNGNVVATVTGHDIKAGTEETVDFKQTLSPLYDKAEYTASVTVTGDEDATNNVSPVAVAELTVSKFPAVNDLEAKRTDGGVSLSWSAPSTTGFDVKPVEDFEDAKAWTEEVENWTMVDRDGQQIGTLDGAGLPDAVGMRTRHSFFVFDSESEDIFFYNPELANLVKGNSGSKTLVAMYTLSFAVDQDDWAISPVLNGSAQTISFYARSYHPEYLDRMEVLYSTTDSTDPDDFVSLCEDGAFEVPQLTDATGNAAYKYYEFNLPEGARRLALRAHNAGGDGFMLMIDDVKLEVANAVLQIVSYDIYRDGVKINEAPVTEPSYTDAEADGSAHRYQVVVNYNRGISPASNVAEVVLGVGSAIAESLGVSVENRTIVIDGAAGTMVRIYTIDGRTIYSGTGSARIPVPAGTYIVSAGSEIFKLLVP